MIYDLGIAALMLERRRDLLREAETERLAKLATNIRQQAGVVQAVGERLLLVGWRLVTRRQPQQGACAEVTLSAGETVTLCPCCGST